mmetsp:Transcript_10298/g.22875  ORF Transcript_10298/g.22875 Transcript_10298/m.22875 type:complete len:264 (-) Transcript_10298:2067-2858(-)
MLDLLQQQHHRACQCPPVDIITQATPPRHTLLHGRALIIVVQEAKTFGADFAPVSFGSAHLMFDLFFLFTLLFGGVQKIIDGVPEFALFFSILGLLGIFVGFQPLKNFVGLLHLFLIIERPGQISLQLSRFVMVHADVGRFAAEANEVPERHLPPGRESVFDEEARFGKVIQDVFFVVPLQFFEGHGRNGLLGHDDELRPGLPIQSLQRIEGIFETICRIFRTVAVVTEAVHAADHPKGPKMYLYLADMILELEVDDTVAVSP